MATSNVVNTIQKLGFLIQTQAENIWPFPLKHCTINISIRDLLVTLLMCLALSLWKKTAFGILLLLMWREPALLCFPYNIFHSMVFYTPRFWDYRAVEPKLQLLLNNPTIQREAMHAMKFTVPFSSHPHQRRIASGQPWSVFSFFSYGTINYENCSKCPVLSSLLLQIPTIKLAMLSCMDGPTHIRKHCGYFKNILRAHITLHLEHPETEHERFIRVGGEDYHWKEGELVVFDDTYPHEVFSAVPGKRLILFLDVERPYASKTLSLVSGLLLKLLQKSPNLKAAAQFQEKNALQENALQENALQENALQENALNKNDI
jgi:aspartyl/asparaginyl beta-hydroxylase (cupin superfamily)